MKAHSTTRKTSNAEISRTGARRRTRRAIKRGDRQRAIAAEFKIIAFDAFSEFHESDYEDGYDSDYNPYEDEYDYEDYDPYEYDYPYEDESDYAYMFEA